MDTLFLTHFPHILVKTVYQIFDILSFLLIILFYIMLSDFLILLIILKWALLQFLTFGFKVFPVTPFQPFGLSLIGSNSTEHPWLYMAEVTCLLYLIYCHGLHLPLKGWCARSVWHIPVAEPLRGGGLVRGSEFPGAPSLEIVMTVSEDC